MMDAITRQVVRQRAEGRCGHCRLPEEACCYPLRVEHIMARQHLVDDSPSNLALACDRCNLYKGPNLSSVDPKPGKSCRSSIPGGTLGTITLHFVVQRSWV
jgi:hypothetical protein